MPAHDQAATPAQQRLRLGRDGARLDARVVDDRPDRLTAQPRRGDLLDRCLDLLLDDGERFLGGAAGGGDAGPQRGFDLPDGAGRIRWCLLPVRQRGQRGDLGLGLDRHGSTPSRNVSLLRRSLGWFQPSRQDSLLESAHGPGQAFAAAAALADRRACAADPHAATADDPGRTGRRDRHLETGRGGERPAAGRSRTGGRHRAADRRRPRPGPGRLVLRPGRRRWRGPRRQHRARRHRGRVRQRLRRHGVARGAQHRQAWPGPGR